ncbi:hypothetical protein ACLKA6_019127 [Drosophila palustris]
MNNLLLLCLLVILIPHCVYAEYYPKIVLYNPSTGQEMDPSLMGAMHLRSARQIKFPGVSDNIIQLPSLGNPCSCEDYVCKCCLGIGIAGANQTTCMRIEYEWRRFGLTVAIDWNDQLLTSFGLSARDMPDFCAPLLLPIPVLTCLRFSNIEIVDVDNSLNLCTSLVFKIVFSEIYEYKFTCMRLGTMGIVHDMDQKSESDAFPLEERAEDIILTEEEAEDLILEDQQTNVE